MINAHKLQIGFKYKHFGVRWTVSKPLNEELYFRAVRENSNRCEERCGCRECRMNMIEVKQ